MTTATGQHKWAEWLGLAGINHPDGPASGPCCRTGTGSHRYANIDHGRARSSRKRRLGRGGRPPPVVLDDLPARRHHHPGHQPEPDPGRVGSRPAAALQRPVLGPESVHQHALVPDAERQAAALGGQQCRRQRVALAVLVPDRGHRHSRPHPPLPARDCRHQCALGCRGLAAEIPHA